MNPFVMHNREDTYHTPSDRATATSTGTSTPTSVSTHSVHGYGNGYGNGYSYGTGNTPRSAPAQNGTLFDSIEDSIKAFARGEFLVVLDSTDRENEGDLVIAAEDLSTEKMAWMVKYTSGLIVAPMTGPHLDRLNLPQMVTNNQESHCTAFTISCDYAVGTTTGISAHDRALTCRKLADPHITATDFRRPGHMFPLRAVDGGVLARQGHTEAAIEFCRLAGKTHVSAICELVREDDGLMMRRDDCFAFARKHGLRVCTIEALVEYIKKRKVERNV